ncbi:MAG: rhomboid family intramembrane serine protease [Zetaproteobacteria bacterium]|nr:rhomboid family intramembrane serine protease [Zetaproteobacteria bacterium]
MQPIPPWTTLVRTTWTGKLILLNLLAFIATSWWSGNLLAPDAGVLYQLGARDVVAIFQGESIRYLTSMFLHFGMLHFTLNMLALRVVGYQIEQILGSLWFLLSYVCTGVGANVFAIFFSTSVGVGASGAIFGLIGVGCCFEYLSEWKKFRMLQQSFHFAAPNLIEASNQQPRFKIVPGPYSAMTILNIALALVLNFLFSLSSSINIGIDQAAHMGGLLTGICMSIAFLLRYPNRLLQRHSQLLSSLTVLTLMSALGYAHRHFTHTDYLAQLFLAESLEMNEPIQKWASLSRGIQIYPNHALLRLQRAEVLLKAGEENMSLQDILAIPTSPENESMIKIWLNRMEKEGFAQQIKKVRAFRN